ncbi:unnamed protein product [Rhizophagus irregularis]|nr:unnamed protein product [Rhizophagus irregularis]
MYTYVLNVQTDNNANNLYQDKVKELGFGTRAIHIGQEPDPSTGAVIPSISLSTTYKQSAIGVHKGYEYSRSNNPNRSAFEESIASLEKGKYALAFSSGSAVTATIVTSIGTNGHIISVDDVYGGTNRYFTKVAGTQGIEATFVNLHDPKNIEGAFKHNTKIVWIETPTNPTLRLVDIRAVANITHQHNAILVYISVTKYINGHSDVVMGVAIMNDEEIYNKIKFLQNAIGAIPSSFDSWLASRGLKTLHLQSHPQHILAKKQARGFGGMLLNLWNIVTAVGVTDNLIRLSIGIEDVDDLLEDIQQALDIAVQD